MELNQKLIDFSDRDWNEEVDFTKMKMISLPCERRFSFIYENKEVLSLNVGEIRRLSEGFRQYFRRCFSEVSEFLMYLILRGNVLREGN